MNFPKTTYACGYCGESKPHNQVHIVTEADLKFLYPSIQTHHCGYIAIRCRHHPNALKNASNSVTKHLRQVVSQVAERYT